MGGDAGVCPALADTKAKSAIPGANILTNVRIHKVTNNRLNIISVTPQIECRSNNQAVIVKRNAGNRIPDFRHFPCCNYLAGLTLFEVVPGRCANAASPLGTVQRLMEPVVVNTSA